MKGKKGKKGGKKKKLRAPVDDEEVTKDDLDMEEAGVEDGEERPSLKMPKTKVKESKKVTPGAEQEESEEEKEDDGTSKKKAVKKKKKKRVINGPEDYDMSKPNDRIAYNIDAADGVVDGKEGGE